MTEREIIAVMSAVTLYLYTVGFGYMWLGQRWDTSKVEYNTGRYVQQMLRPSILEDN
jgi:hypothetical protein